MAVSFSFSLFPCQIPDDVISSILRTTGCDVHDTQLLEPTHSLAVYHSPALPPACPLDLPPTHFSTAFSVLSLCLCPVSCNSSSVVLCSLRLIALSAQRFIFSVAEDAQQLSRLRTKQPTDSEVKVTSTTLHSPRPHFSSCMTSSSALTWLVSLCRAGGCWWRWCVSRVS